MPRSDGERVGRPNGLAVGEASFDGGDAVGGAGTGCDPTNSIDSPVGGGVSAEVLPPELGVVVGSDDDDIAATGDAGEAPPPAQLPHLRRAME